MAEKNISQLISLWEKEKEEYKTAEIGTVVQRFVKHVFECKELFNLEEGHLATSGLKRKNEFFSQTVTNAGFTTTALLKKYFLEMIF